MNKRQKKKQQKRTEQLGKTITELLQNDYIINTYEDIRICYHKKTKIFLALKLKNINDFMIIPNKNLKKLIKKKFKKALTTK